MRKPQSDFGHVFDTRKHKYAVYFEGLLCGYVDHHWDAHYWLDMMVSRVYGEDDPRRLQLRVHARVVRAAVASCNHRAKRLGIPGVILLEDWIGMLAFFGLACIHCGKRKRLPSPDHVIPMSQGGPNIIANIQPICLSCNSSKSNEWTDYRDPAQLSAFLARYAPKQDK